jgi:nucleoside-diphosphate-sugar epimerase
MVNIGLNFEISAGNTLNLMCNLMKSDDKFVTDKHCFRQEKFEVFRFSFDNTKISDLTGFKPESNIRQGVQEAINWLTRQENLAECKANNIKYLKAICLPTSLI